jgi:DNA-binding response OmpR family regulator
MSEFNSGQQNTGVAVDVRDSYLLDLAQAESLTVRIALRLTGLEARRTTSLDGFIQRTQQRDPAIVIITVDQITRHHLLVISDVRALTQAPLLVISEGSSGHMRLAAFEAGADDHVESVVGPHELAARIHAKLRRVTADPTLQPRPLTFRAGARVKCHSMEIPRRSRATV